MASCSTPATRAELRLCTSRLPDHTQRAIHNVSYDSIISCQSSGRAFQRCQARTWRLQGGFARCSRGALMCRLSSWPHSRSSRQGTWTDCVVADTVLWTKLQTLSYGRGPPARCEWCAAHTRRGSICDAESGRMISQGRSSSKATCTLTRLERPSGRAARPQKINFSRRPILV